MSTLGAAAARGTAWLGLVNLLSKGSQILVTLALGVFLPARELGVVTVAVVMVNLGQTLQSMGVYDVVSRARTGDPRRFAGTVVTTSVAAALVATAVLVAGGGLLAGWIGAPGAAGPIRVIALSLPFTAYYGVQMAYLHRILDFRRRLLPDAGSALAGAAVTIGAAWAGAGAWSVVAGVCTTALLAPLLGLAVGVRLPARLDRADLAQILGWVRLVGPAAVLGVLLLNIDYVVVTRALGETATGVYSYAYRFAFVPYIMVAVVLSGVAFPIYSRHLADAGHAQGTDRTATRAAGALLAPVVARIVHALLAVTGGLYVALALLAPRIVLIDERWAGSAPVLTVLCGYGLLLGLLLAAYDALRAAGRPGTFLAAQATHVVLLVVAAVIGVRLGGIVGVAWAQVVAAVLVQAGMLLALRDLGVLRAATARVAAGPALAAAVTVGAHTLAARAGVLPGPASVTGLAVDAALVTACYLGVLVAVDRSALAELRGLRG